MQPTPKQTRCLWSFCVHFGSDGHDNEKWAELGRQGAITKRSVSPIIGNIKDFEKATDADEVKRLKNSLEKQLGRLFPGFKIVSNPFPDGPEKQKPGAEEKAGDGSGDGKPGKPSDYDPTKDDGEADKVRRMLEALEEEMEEAMPKPTPRPDMPTFETSPGYIKPPEFDAICCALLAGENVLLTGPAGLGKSRLGKEIAYAFNKLLKKDEEQLETFVVSFAGGMRYAQMFGSTQIFTDDAGNQVSKWEPAPTLKSFVKRCVTVIDEIFSADADANNGLNSVLEPDDRSILTPIGKIDRNEKNYVVATANANGRSLSNKYTAVNVADTALLDRFVEFPMDYNVDVENTMLLDIGDAEVESYFRENLDKLRAAIKANNIFFDASTRRLKRAINLYKNAFNTKEEAFRRCFLVSLSDAEKSKCGF